MANQKIMGPAYFKGPDEFHACGDLQLREAVGTSISDVTGYIADDVADLACSAQDNDDMDLMASAQHQAQEMLGAAHRLEAAANAILTFTDIEHNEWLERQKQ